LDLIVFYLHGYPGGRAWFGDQDEIALREDTLARCHLGGKIVFAASCNAGDAKSPMRDAIFKAGATWLIAGSGHNYTSPWIVVGVNILLYSFVRFVTRSGDVLGALRWAKRMTRIFGSRWTKASREAIADSLAFRAWRNDENTV
jgi:hypothetical protein